jgi:hypothetical protein
MKPSILRIGMMALLLAASPFFAHAQGEDQKGNATATERSFGLLRDGMTYADAVKTLGKDGRQTSRNVTGKQVVEHFTWKMADGGRIWAAFEGGLLFLKDFKADDKEEEPKQSSSDNQTVSTGITGTPSLYSSLPLDLKAEKLPPQFRGHDVVRLYNALTTNVSPKSEFETTQAYNERLRKELSKPILGQLPVTGQFAVLLNRPLNTVYDADRQVMQVSITVANSHSNDLEKPKALEIAEKETPLDEYIGENAFGTKRRVLKFRRDTYGILFNNIEDFAHEKADTFFPITITWDVPMTVATAMAAKEHSRLLLVFRLVQPYTRKWSNYVTPTINDPAERDLHWLYVNATIDELWLYNFDTGDIYHKAPVRPRDLTGFITLRHAKQLSDGMKYADVVKMLGREGTLNRGLTGGGTAVYDWTNPDGSFLRVWFTRNRLIAKAPVRLPE